MKIIKPKFWEKKYSLMSLLMFPIAALLQLLLVIKKILTVEHSFKIPIICIGNIYIGGTGKTPLSIMIANELIKNKRKPAIIKKYYSKHIDEHNLINSSLNSLFLSKDRSLAINDAQKKHYNIAILDDGFQDYSIKKDLSILCFNAGQLIGNGMTLPSGPLRENMSSIKKSQIILINGKKNKEFENKIFNISKKVEIFYSSYIPMNIKDFKNKNLFAFAGIGNPNNFFKLLSDNNLNIKKKLIFPDHYEFSKLEIKEMISEAKENKFELITTEKDYFRIKKYNFKNVKFLKIKLNIFKKDKLIRKILKCL
ncbi:tetraacyldisaccharide 4'-kinase [Pelagibacteraceae bacterium]|jgi:tetraacyldisaccharide 4'-kinase|nr:tetraacyldisaccharide 4'-kinase [Pelagibacteraceae bacterium]